MSRRWPLLVAAVLTVAAVGVGLLVLGGGGPDPRLAWAADAEDVCSTSANAIGALEVPAFDDREQLAATSAAISEALNQQAEGIAQLDTPGEAEQLSELLASQTRERAQLHETFAAGGDVDNIAERDGEAVSKIVEAFTSAGLAAPSCARLANPGDAQRLAVDDWLAAAADTCEAAAVEYRAADTAAAAGELDRAAYLVRLRSVTASLGADLAAAGDAPNDAIAGPWRVLVTNTAGFVDALDSEDIDTALKLSREWAAAAVELALPGCDQGIAVDTENPSGLFEVPDLAGVPMVGMADGQITDAARFTQLAGELVIAAGGTSIENRFGLGPLLSQMGVGTADADTAASPTAVSATVPALLDPALPASELNPYEMFVAARDAGGGCITVRIWGEAGPAGAETVGSNGACTAAR